ncbi:MAG: polysaccharide deacetylase family protein [Bacteroidales bacterium]|jgi:peptidoglycan/xylan/chitin deacetylase (PgdA/CDA1 family)|nr:polysaccharide deacetylase family protein [Bacteroidales bacterium]
MNKTFYKLSQKIKLLPYNSLLKISGQKIILPFYHCVSNDNPVHIRNLYNIRTTEDFEKDLDFFLKYYEAIDFTQLKSLINKDKIKKKCFLLSFDDGLREFHDIIAPILMRKGIPAVCFLNTDFIDNKKMFYRFKAGILIETLKSNSSSPAEKTKIDQWFEDNFPENGDIYSSLLSINYNNSHLLDELASITGTDFNDYLKAEKPYLTTEQINDLIKKGFHFGAHSLDHPQYSEISESEKIVQTKNSIENVIKSFDLNYRLFSFPFSDINVPKDFFEIIFNPENPIADLTFGTAGLKKDEVKNNLQRIPMEVDNFAAEDILYGEYMYYILKSFFNKNVIRREMRNEE